MQYILLIIGAAITVYAFLQLDRVEKGSLQDTAKAAFNDSLRQSGQPPLDAGILYTLKESVENQLAEVGRQREMVSFLMMRVEKRLDALENRPSGPVSEEKEEPGRISPEELERTRLHSDIFALHSQGLTVSEISKQVGRGKGEVELILNLKK